VHKLNDEADPAHDAETNEGRERDLLELCNGIRLAAIVGNNATANETGVSARAKYRQKARSTQTTA
jgi:hypothetical protein